MISQSDIAIRYEDHQARVEPVNREGWRQEAARTARGSSARGMASVVHRLRRTIANTLVRAGERLPGAPTGAPVNPARMRSFLLPLVLGGVLAGTLTAAPGASADPDPDFAKRFTIDCGAAGTFPVVFVESNLGTFHLIGSTGIFQSTSLTIDGEVIFAEPGFARNGREQVTCTFIGVRTGRHFTVTGFFTPPTG